jgi:biotin carboxylase
MRCPLLTTGPAIVKPVDSSGGRGVYRTTVHSTEAEKKAAFEFAFSMSPRRRILVEEFVQGPEFSVESITWRGRTRTVAITGKTTSGPPYYFEVGHVVPAPLGATAAASIRATVKSIIDLTGIDNCATHAELILTEKGPVLVEIAARLGGGYINTDLVPLALGVDMVRSIIDVALDREPDLEATRQRAAAIRFIIPEPGVVSVVTGIDEVKSLDGIARVVCDYAPGDAVPTVRDATGRRCYVIGSAPDVPAVQRLIEKATSTLRVQTRNHE